MSDGLRLFLVEDDDDITLLIRKSLQRAGHQLTRCRLASDALIVLSQSVFDLILLDQYLPDMEGLDLLGRIQHEGIGTPVLMITGRDDSHLATRVLQAGALDYIVKDPALLFLTELPKRVAASVHRNRLEQTNQLLAQALGYAQDGILITDLQGTILEVNEALLRQTGYSRDELLGQSPRVFKSDTHSGEFYQGMWQTILGRASWQGELVNRRKDGQFRDMSVTISPIMDRRGRMTHFVGIYRDVTDDKRLEQQLIQMQKLQSVGNLAGGIAHEFNNLMAGINGYAALGLRELASLANSSIANTPALDEMREFFTHIVTLSERAASLTRQLLTFARKPTLVQQPTSPAELLRSTTELVQRTLQQPVQLDLPAEDSGVPLLLVEADPNQLQQALVNLALNSRDAILEKSRISATSAAPATITFRLCHALRTQPTPAFPQAVPPGDYVLIEVKDPGNGMTPSVRQQALDPFFTTKEVGQGTGLGLPMVYGIVQAHRGFLTIESESGRGTTMGLYLPRLTQPTVEPPAPSEFLEPQLVEPESAPKQRILVVDDEEAILDVIRRFLEIAGHQVRGAATGQVAAEALLSLPLPDLIILDMMMPREDPQQLFYRLRKGAPGVPILLTLGIAENPLVRTLVVQPLTAMIRKPFRMNELWYAVQALLQARAAKQP